MDPRFLYIGAATIVTVAALFFWILKTTPYPSISFRLLNPPLDLDLTGDCYFNDWRGSCSYSADKTEIRGSFSTGWPASYGNRIRIILKGSGGICSSSPKLEFKVGSQGTRYELTDKRSVHIYDLDMQDIL